MIAVGVFDLASKCQKGLGLGVPLQISFRNQHFPTLLVLHIGQGSKFASQSKKLHWGYYTCWLVRDLESELCPDGHSHSHWLLLEQASH